MKRILTIIIVLFVLFATSCSGSGKDNGEISADEFNTKIPVQEVTQNKIDEVKQEEIRDSELDNLVKSFVFPPMSADNLSFDEGIPGLPFELINQLKEAVYNGTSDTLIQELNDRSLMITAEDFAFKPNPSDDIDIAEKQLNDVMQNGAADFFIYQCDTNGDGIDEIIMIQNLEYDYSNSNCAYILKKSGDKYVYAGHDYPGYYRCFAILKNNDRFYLITNYDDYQTKTTKAVGIFALNGDNSGFMWLLNNQHTYLRKTIDGYQYNLLYENINAPMISELQTYINEIGTDLVYTDRTHGTFYGNETERNDLLDEEGNSNYVSDFRNIHAVDVNNDGQDEFFDRKILYDAGGDIMETKVNWYNPKTKSGYPAPFTVWSPAGYFLTQQWFKTMNGKTVIFSLYHKTSEDTYLLDARINEDGQTIILLDYMINLQINIELSDYWNYNDTNFVEIVYNDPDIEKAFPEDLNKRTKSFAAKVQGDFAAVNYKDENIPNSLIVQAEKALFNENFDEFSGMVSFEINKDDFYDNFEQYTGYDSKEGFDSYVSHIYKYKLDNNTYFISVADSGGSARFVDINIYKESDDGLTVLDNWHSLDINARVIKYNGALYFIESSYNYYSKYTDTINIYKLVPEKIKDYVTIELKPKQFEWEEVFNNQQSYDKSISSYIDSIKNDLMDKSPINDNIQLYLGDEKNKYNEDKQLRLKSVGGDHDYYEIDFNNDGETEYFEKHFWFPSNYTTLYLINNFYRFTDKRTISINGDFDRDNSTLIQLWFKELEGKVFTFRLFLNDKYNYYLNVSLVEGTNITQVQSYLIVPKNEFSISTQERR